MSEAVMTDTGDVLPGGAKGVVADFSADKQTFQMPWGKAMMWFFLLSDTFIFGCFLTSYMTVRMSVRDAWPIPREVFALSFGGEPIPLILIAIMTFILISSSGTMAMAVKMGYRGDKNKAFWLMIATAAFGASFVGMQAFEWTKLIVDESHDRDQDQWNGGVADTGRVRLDLPLVSENYRQDVQRDARHHDQWRHCPWCRFVCALCQLPRR